VNDLTPRVQDDYVDIGLVDALSKIAFGPNVILKGPKGAGKSLAFDQVAAKHGVPLMRQDCCEDTNIRDLVGTFSAQGGDVFFQMGALTSAIDVANEVGGCILVLEEVNTLPPMSQKILNPMTDYRRSISSAKVGHVWSLKKDALLWVCGTMNPNYAGTYSLNEDFRSRFEFIEVGYMPQDKERELLLKQFPSKPSATERRDVDLVLNLAKETRGERMGYALSTRDLVQFVRNMLKLNRDQSLKLLEGKYDGENVKDFQARVQTTFGVNLAEVGLY
jgi:MoxR-like ATPase